MSDDFKDLLSQMDDDEPERERGLADLLGGGLPDVPGGVSGEGGGLESLLGGLLGGGAAGGSGSGDMGDLLGGLLGGGGGAGASGGLGDLLGGLLGGGGGGATGGPGAAGGGLGDLLGGLLGGGQPMTFGGGGGPTLPFANTLAEKLGISPQMANMLIMGAIGLLTASAAKKRSSGRSGAVDLNSLADPDYIRSSGVASRLSAQMGISEDEAVAGLQQTMGLMAARQNPPAAKKTGARKTTAKKTTGAAPAKKKTTAKATKTTPKKKSSPSASDSDFMDLLDDAHPL